MSQIIKQVCLGATMPGKVILTSIEDKTRGVGNESYSWHLDT